MNVLIAGVFTPESTNTPMADTLEAMGHTVVRFPYRDIGKETGPDGLATHLMRASSVVDLAIICKGCGGDAPPMYRHVLAELPCNTLYWLPDSTEVQGLAVVDLAMGCKVACATSLVSCEGIRSFGHENVHQIFEGFDPSVFLARKKRKTTDVTFAGSITEHRAWFLGVLESNGIEVHQPTAYRAVLSKEYARSRIVLNFVHGEIFSDRVTQTLASGAFCLSEHCKDLESAYRIGTDLDTFRSWHELPVKVRQWLEDDDRREAVARSGNAAVQAYTWQAQMKKLLRAANGEWISDGAFRV